MSTDIFFMVTLKLQAHLDAVGVTQTQLAREMMCAKQYLSELSQPEHHGRRQGISLRQLCRICDCLGRLGHDCRPEDLYHYEPGEGKPGF